MVSEARRRPISAWVVERSRGDGTFERLSDARRLADAIGVRVGAVAPGGDPAALIAQGADLVVQVSPGDIGPDALLLAATEILKSHPVRVVLSGGDADNRALAARLAVRCGWALVSPALEVAACAEGLRITHLDPAGRRTRQVTLPSPAAAVVTIRDGVAEAVAPNPNLRGAVIRHDAPALPEPVRQRRHVPADPAARDIRHARRLVCGGRGVGGTEGFRQLARVARLLEAGVAATRVAVDQGWVEYERQVGQTGKTVRPSLYLGCGVSGASHHLEGMLESEHIIAINNDREAPLLRKAHLGLVADLHQVLDHLERALDGRRR